MPTKISIDRYRDKRPRSTPPDIAKKKAIAKAKKVKAAKLKEEASEPGTSLALIPAKKLKRLEQTQDLMKKASTTFGVPSKQLYSMIQDGQVDQAIITFQRQMLATILRLIPIAEAQYRKEKKEHTAYALNSLVSQARELAADIASSADRAGVAETILAEFWMPTFTSFVQSLVTEAQTLKSSLRSKVRPESAHAADLAVDDLVKQMARTGNELFRVNAEGIRDLLGAPKKRGVPR